MSPSLPAPTVAVTQKKYVVSGTSDVTSTPWRACPATADCFAYFVRLSGCAVAESA